MKYFHKELKFMATAAILCSLLASGTVLAEGSNNRTASAKRNTQAELAFAQEISSNLPENRLAAQLAKSAEEKAAEKAVKEAEEKAEEVAEKAAKATEEKAAEETKKKAAQETAVKEAKKAVEAEMKEISEMEALGLSADARLRVNAEELNLLAAIIHCEAGGEEMTGRIAVGAVVLNRVLSTEFENSIQEVVYAPGQFTPAMTGLLDQTLAEGIDDECYAAAKAALNGENPVGDCLYFNCGYGEGIQIGYQHFY